MAGLGVAPAVAVAQPPAGPVLGPLFTLDPAGVPPDGSPSARGLRLSEPMVERLRDTVLAGAAPSVQLDPLLLESGATAPRRPGRRSRLVSFGGEIDGPADVARMHNEYSWLVSNNLQANCLRNGSRVHLQAWTGEFVRAEDGGGGLVDAVSTRPGEWEAFRLERLEGEGLIGPVDDVALRSADGSYLRVLYRDEPVRRVYADSLNVGPWEHFTIFVP